MLFKKKDNTSRLELKWRLIGILGKLFIDLLFAFSRVEIKGRARVAGPIASRRCIFAFWHDRILLISYVHKGWHAAILASDSADGEIIAQILQRQGYFMVRGSTGKGGVRALKQLLQEARQHRRMLAIVPDGPQGPRHKVQQGVILLAQKTGYPIIPISYSAKRIKRFNSWDRFLLPHPATDCMLIYGHPITVPTAIDSDLVQRYAWELEEELMRITRQADAHFGHRFE